MSELLEEERLSEHRSLQLQFHQFVAKEIEPYVIDWENNEGISLDIVTRLKEAQYFGLTMPKKLGGLGHDYVTYGMLNEEIGYASVSLSGLLNVHTMVTETILKWGTEEQKNTILIELIKGQKIGALALTEPEAGSDLTMIQTEYINNGDSVILNGHKKWITFGGLADIILVFGKMEGKHVAYLVDKDTPGLTIKPIKGMLGFKASYLAELKFDHCIIPQNNMVGRPGFALSHLAPYALTFGRLSIAFASVGLIKACLSACGKYVTSRKSFNTPLIQHGMISHMITEMGVDLEAARLLALQACQAKDQNKSDVIEQMMIAKYFASRAAVRHASNAVQIMGAQGCNEEYGVARFYRDCKALEIVEGSSQIHEMILGPRFARKGKRL
ncbi:acyl-CoA dehydrogenase family protein [Paenibacillus silvae]|uniref:acyl-CoA dehydrogenase family protein n=1 Tax=Paenibacillus silvae TaxID=1325358 RepID=UPI002003CAC9|nr:acyl-CoA dehydrogenase family protein [Paenibacillus silvae]MCK6076574.1 acyl-CoA dehydrogenase family protein [Paenibacillus silvae]MCK6151001.1 acyl-CoA dehydrogenase family protein [Paenibacillus silvae]MCK6269261.1 acyl-CoA dehydrogenase family protein [Paenibacillus silvae]